MPFMCTTCGKFFTAKRSLRRHEDSAHRNVRFYCKLCSGEFARADSLSLHVKSKHCQKIVIKAVDRQTKKRKRREKATTCAVRIKRIKKQTDCEYNLDVVSNNKAPPQPADTFHKDKDPTPPSPDLANNPVDPMDAVLWMLNQDVSIKPESGMDTEDCCQVPVESAAPPNPERPMNGPAPPLEPSQPTAMTNLSSSVGSSLQNTQQNEIPATYSAPVASSKPKRSLVDQEIDFTVLDILQQSALDGKDEDRMFLLSILSDFKRVPVEKKLRVKAKIVGAIVEALD